MVLDASVKKTNMIFSFSLHPHLLQKFAYREQLTSPDKWTSLTASIEPPTSTRNRPNWLSLAPKHTGAEFNLRQGSVRIRKLIRLRKWIRLPLRRMSQASTLKLTPPTNGKMNRLQCLKKPYMKGKRWSLQICYISCTTQPSCQTVNYNLGVKTCQLNDTKHSRPKYFVEKPVLVYA